MVCIVTRKWRVNKPMLGLFLFELALTVPMLALAGIADGNTYRTGLWQNGYDLGFNSSPEQIIYEAANYQPLKNPLVWSGFTVQFDIVIAVLSMFLLLAKSAMFIMHVLLPTISVTIHAVLIALYAIAIHNQSAPDMSDPQHPSPGMPWMMSKGCKYATPQNKSYCMQAVALFAVTICMMTLFTVYLGLSVWSCIPTEEERAARTSDIELKKSVLASFKTARETDEERAERWEKNRAAFMNLPATPGYDQNGAFPMTPRTKAFTSLNGAPPTATSAHFPRSSQDLPIRAQYG